MKILWDLYFANESQIAQLLSHKNWTHVDLLAIKIEIRINLFLCFFLAKRKRLFQQNFHKNIHYYSEYMYLKCTQVLCYVLVKVLKYMYFVSGL